MTISSNPLDDFVQPVIGLAAWGVRQGYGSFLTLEFGEPKMEVHERQKDGRVVRDAYVHGQWHLWIYCCHWRVFQDRAELAWSEDAEEAIRRAAAALNGQKLLGVRVYPDEGRSTFAFGLGGSIETWPYGDDPSDEQWTIMTDAEACTYRADGTYARGPSAALADEESWLPFR